MMKFVAKLLLVTAGVNIFWSAFVDAIKQRNAQWKAEIETK